MPVRFFVGLRNENNVRAQRIVVNGYLDRTRSSYYFQHGSTPFGFAPASSVRFLLVFSSAPYCAATTRSALHSSIHTDYLADSTV